MEGASLSIDHHHNKKKNKKKLNAEYDCLFANRSYHQKLEDKHEQNQGPQQPISC